MAVTRARANTLRGALQAAQEHHDRRGDGGEKQREQKRVGDCLELRGLGERPDSRCMGEQRGHKSNESEMNRAQGERGVSIVAGIAQRETLHGLFASFLRSGT